MNEKAPDSQAWYEVPVFGLSAASHLLPSHPSASWQTRAASSYAEVPGKVDEAERVLQAAAHGVPGAQPCTQQAESLRSGVEKDLSVLTPYSVKPPPLDRTRRS